MEDLNKLSILISKLEYENQVLRLKLSELQSSMTALHAVNVSLKQENDYLKEKLGLNSTNSSIPSSKEFHRAKKDSKKQGSGRRAGGQPGHKGHQRERLPADEVIDIPLEHSMCGCGGRLRLFAEPYIHQQVEIPPIKPHVTEYHLAHAECVRCRRRKMASLPEGVTGDTFGPRVKTTVAALSSFYKNSKRDIQLILQDMFGLKMSLGSVSNSEGRVSKKCQSAYEAIREEVSHAPLVHMDETSHYLKGKLGWCWLFASEKASFIQLEESRSKKVLESSVFGEDDQFIISDRYAAYNYFNRSNRQVCWAHLDREFTRFEHSRHKDVKLLGMVLCDITKELFALKKSLTHGRIEWLVFMRRARKLRRRLWKYLKRIEHLSDAPHAARVATNILKSEDMMWTFLFDPMHIPLTNNHAEQQIRHYVVYRKNSYFTQSKRGNAFLERTISLYLTAKLKAINPFNTMFNLVATA